MIFFCISVPSKPRDVKYSFIYDKKSDYIYLRLRWKAPVYTGDSIYSYQLVHITEETSSPHSYFLFLKFTQNLILDREDDEYIHFEAIWMDSTNKKRLHKNFTIYAINDNGWSSPYNDATHGISFIK